MFCSFTYSVFICSLLHPQLWASTHSHTPLTHTHFKKHTHSRLFLMSHWPCSVSLSSHVGILDQFNCGPPSLSVWEWSGCNGREALYPYGSTGNSIDAWVARMRGEGLVYVCEVSVVFLSVREDACWVAADRNPLWLIRYRPGRFHFKLIPRLCPNFYLNYD